MLAVCFAASFSFFFFFVLILLLLFFLLLRSDVINLSLLDSRFPLFFIKNMIIHLLSWLADHLDHLDSYVDL